MTARSLHLVVPLLVSHGLNICLHLRYKLRVSRLLMPFHIETYRFGIRRAEKRGRELGVLACKLQGELRDGTALISAEIGRRFENGPILRVCRMPLCGPTVCQQGAAERRTVNDANSLRLARGSSSVIRVSFRQ